MTTQLQDLYRINESSWLIKTNVAVRSKNFSGITSPIDLLINVGVRLEQPDEASPLARLPTGSVSRRQYSLGYIKKCPIKKCTSPIDRLINLGARLVKSDEAPALVRPPTGSRSHRHYPGILELEQEASRKRRTMIWPSVGYRKPLYRPNTLHGVSSHPDEMEYIAQSKMD